MFGWDDAIVLGLMAADFVYHRWIDPPPAPKLSKTEFTLPTTQAGAPYPLIYGRCRVRQPALAWVDTAKAMAGSSIAGLVPSGSNAQWVYGLDMLFVLGIPFEASSGYVHVRNLWAGETLLGTAPSLASLDGNRAYNSGTGLWDHADVGGGLDAAVIIYGQLEFLNGNSSQRVVDGSGNPQSNAGKATITAGIDFTTVPAYRNFACAYLGGLFSGTSFRFIVGPSPQVPAFSFEVQSLPASWWGPNQQVAVLDGDLTVQLGDANPMDVLYDLLVGAHGKLGLPATRIDTASFIAAAKTLDTEGNGFSRAWDQGTTASECVAEIMRQIDGVLREDPSTGLISVKLVRADYTVSALPLINPSNCSAVQNFALGGLTGIPNKVLLTFSDRGDAGAGSGYRDGSATAQNMANAVGQDGETREVTLSFPGVCSQANADAIAGRELSARSRPLMKCRAIVDRSFYQTLPGDVVRLTWPEYNLSGVVMRVANVSRGTLTDGKIALDLMQDYFYVNRAIASPISGLGGFGVGLRH